MKQIIATVILASISFSANSAGLTTDQSEMKPKMEGKHQSFSERKASILKKMQTRYENRSACVNKASNHKELRGCLRKNKKKRKEG